MEAVRVCFTTEVAEAKLEIYVSPCSSVVKNTGVSAHDQNFPDVIAGEEEFNRGEVAEERFDMAVVEDALQAEALGDGGVNGARGSAAGFAAKHDALHLQRIFADNVKAVAGRVGAGVFGVKEREQHSTRLQYRPQASHDRPDEAFVEIIRKIPAEHDIEVGRRVDEIVGKKFAAIENNVSLFVLGDEAGLGRGDQQVFAIDAMAALSEVADIRG